MRPRKLYYDKSLIIEFLKELTIVETLENNWSTKYFNTKTGLYWLKSQINSEYHGGGNSILIQLPEPSTDELIEITLFSINEDEVIAASLRLRDNEQYHEIDYRQKLIDKLNEIDLYDLHYSEKKRLINIIEYSELDSEINRRKILNKHFDEVQNDANYFRNIAKQADTILRRLDRK
ncbi:hypothetical protein [Flavobacterium flavipallidum]|uniref:Uncharacterized protein n=1 Tax=Flavobacterium flavipallidum TaxID=3139140 RepID=A0ABU9HJW2_9FLAO